MKSIARILIGIFMIAFCQKAFSQNLRIRPKQFEIVGMIPLIVKGPPIRIVLEEKGSIIFAGKWGVSLSHNFYTNRARSLPHDFKCCFLDTEPPDLLETYSLRALNNFSTSADKLRLGIECGVAWLYYRSANFIILENHNGIDMSKSYKVSYTARHSVGLSLRIKAEIIISKIAGIELASVANINASQFYVGLELYLTGKLVKEKTRRLKHNKSSRHYYL